MTQQLTIPELQTLIDIIAQVNVPVGQVQPFVDLINKMSHMMDNQKQVERLKEDVPPEPPTKATA